MLRRLYPSFPRTRESMGFVALCVAYGAHGWELI